MKSSKEQIDKIEETLIAAYRKQEDLKLPPDWRQQVMQDIVSLARPTAVPPEKKIKTIFPRRTRALAAVALAAIAGWLILTNLDWYDPWISLKPDLVVVESHTAYWLEAGDRDSGVRNVQVTVVQKEVKVKVLSHSPKPSGRIWGITDGGVKKVEIPLVIDAQALGLQEGTATLLITAHDLSWRNGFQGRCTTLVRKLVITRGKSP